MVDPQYIGGYPYTTRPKLRDHWTFRALALPLHASSSALRYIKSGTRFGSAYVNRSRKRQAQPQTRCLPYDVTNVDLIGSGPIEIDRKNSRNSMTLAEAPENAACTDPETCRTCSRPTAQMPLEPENILSLTGTSNQPRDYPTRRNREESSRLLPAATTRRPGAGLATCKSAPLVAQNPKLPVQAYDTISITAYHTAISALSTKCVAKAFRSVHNPARTLIR